jgi:hypothetical protein
MSNFFGEIGKQILKVFCYTITDAEEITSFCVKFMVWRFSDDFNRRIM